MAENDAVPDLSMNKAIKTELAEDEGPSSAQAESSSHIQNRRNLSDTLMSEFQRCLADQGGNSIDNFLLYFWLEKLA